MAIPRMHLVDESCSSLYHCVSRTVRQAFLLAPQSDGVVDNHRRDWVVERVRFLSEVFAIDCVSLAVMSNHLHLLLRTLPEVVESWSAREVAHRWLMLCPPRMLRKKQGIDPDAPPQEREIELLAARTSRIARLRGRLSSLSWYMKSLKEHIARRVNREEGRTGAFWEERFKCFRVLDDPGILRCATYIDLNPVAAGMVDEPMLATYTSIAEFAGSMVGISCSIAGSGDADRRRAARTLWQAVLAGSADERSPAGARAGGAGGQDDADVAARRERDLDAFIASFDDVKFHPALPARREPHHPQGAARDDEPIEAVPVLGRLDRMAASAIRDEADTAGLAPGVSADATGRIGSQGAPQKRAGSDEPGHDPGDDAGVDDQDCRSTPAGERAASGSSRPVEQARRVDRIPLPAPRQARHRRIPPDEHVHDITLGEHFRRLRRLAAMAQERGKAKRSGRFPRRSVVEIEMALGREADDRGIAALYSKMFGEMFGSDVGESAREIAELLSGLMGSARHFGTAIGSKAALAAEAVRRGRKRVVAALRTEPPRRCGRVAAASADADDRADRAVMHGGSDPGTPRAG